MNFELTGFTFPQTPTLLPDFVAFDFRWLPRTTVPPWAPDATSRDVWFLSGRALALDLGAPEVALFLSGRTKSFECS